VPAADGGHAGGSGGGGRSHRVAALAHQHHGLLGGDDAGSGGRGQLTDAVPGDRADPRERVGRVGEEVECRDEAGGDQQRLGDLGVADGVRVGLGAVVGEVDARDRGQPVEPRGEGRVLEPRREEAGGLGPLAGSDDDEHGVNCAGSRGGHAGRTPTKLTR
jgi:hypothetical protein